MSIVDGRLILTSYTPREWTGGVNRWVNDFISGFPTALHYSWWDVVKDHGDSNIPEWKKATILNRWLMSNGLIKKNDIVVTDGFWGLGLEDHPNVVSVAHGIWSHLTLDDVNAGKYPEFPQHHAVQVEYRKKHLERGGSIVAVSEFIQNEMKRQFGFDSTVINNAIDLKSFVPRLRREDLVIHGATTVNKGSDHIDAVRKAFPLLKIMILDEAASFLDVPKYEALARAKCVIQPSAYEGNSYFVLETLACDVPIVAYDVGLLYSLRLAGESNEVGMILDRTARSPGSTVEGMRTMLKRLRGPHTPPTPRRIASRYAVEKFHLQWKKFLKEKYGHDPS